MGVLSSNEVSRFVPIHFSVPPTDGVHLVCGVTFTSTLSQSRSHSSSPNPATTSPPLPSFHQPHPCSATSLDGAQSSPTRTSESEPARANSRFPSTPQPLSLAYPRMPAGVGGDGSTDMKPPGARGDTSASHSCFPAVAPPTLSVGWDAEGEEASSAKGACRSAEGDIGPSQASTLGLSSVRAPPNFPERRRGQDNSQDWREDAKFEVYAWLDGSAGSLVLSFAGRHTRGGRDAKRTTTVVKSFKIFTLSCA